MKGWWEIHFARLGCPLKIYGKRFLEIPVLFRNPPNPKLYIKKGKPQQGIRRKMECQSGHPTSNHTFCLPSQPAACTWTSYHLCDARLFVGITIGVARYVLSVAKENREEIQNASLSDRFFFLRRNKYEIPKVRYFPGEKLFRLIWRSSWIQLN